ncbi:MAG: mannose-6-phosphate isomerase, class I [Microbacteriaceae bacterium]|nr:mannose-6-phosphate isomerase, class I [Microbacteriaceae bacterium]
MFVGITNRPRPYAWGSRTAIAELLGWEPSGGPEAELWLGAHRGSPSRIVDPEAIGGAVDLEAWIAADPSTTLGSYAHSARLPFLLKLLAARSPLSLQAHPTAEKAREGFRRENETGVPLDAPHRNYRDEHSKPELIYALSERFEALCGFRTLTEYREILAILHRRAAGVQVAPLDALLELVASDDALPDVVEWLSRGGDDVDAVVALVADLAARPPAPGEDGRFDTAFATAVDLAVEYPGDPGIVVSLLLNRVSLRRGQALYLPAGNIHAYLSGLGVELMAASDNVLRGGLTPKHVDVPELLNVLDFTPRALPVLTPERPSPGLEVYRPTVPDFVLVRFGGGAPATFPLHGPAIAICTRGSVALSGASSARLDRGSAVYITPDEAEITLAGDGEVFVATTG